MVERQINDFGIEPSGRRKSLHKDRQRKGKNVYNSHIYSSLLLGLLNLRNEKLKIVTTSWNVNVYL
jgi:hypothetical protein